SVCTRSWRIFACARPAVFHSVVDLRCARRDAERLDHLLGRDRLVRRARGVYLVPVGIVGIAALYGSTTKPLPFSLADAIRLSPRHRRISLYGCDVAPIDR